MSRVIYWDDVLQVEESFYIPMQAGNIPINDATTGVYSCHTWWQTPSSSTFRVLQVFSTLWELHRLLLIWQITQRPPELNRYVHTKGTLWRFNLHEIMFRAGKHFPRCRSHYSTELQVAATRRETKLLWGICVANVSGGRKWTQRQEDSECKREL